MMKLSILIFVLYVLNKCDCKSINIADKKPISFNDTIIQNKFGARGFSGSWMNGNEFIFDSSSNIMRYNTDLKQRTETVYNKDFVSRWKSPTLKFASDDSKVLIRYEPRSIFRHSTVAKFSVVYKDDLSTEFKISDGDELQLCTLSPKGNSLIFIRNNTIFYTTDERIKANLSPRRASNVGIPGEVYNGIPDWVYEEEVLGSDAAAWFSPDSNYLVYATFDDKEVPEYTYELYGDGKGIYKYPQEVHLRYPKVGENNPIVELYLVDLSVSLSTLPYIPLNTPTDIVTSDHILGRVFWISNKKLGAIWLNRRQNKGVIVSYTYVNDDLWEIETIKEINEPNGWIDLNTPKCESNEVCYFISNSDNWPSLTRMDVNTKTLTALTKNKHVFTYLGLRDGKIFYSATPGPLESFKRHTYVLDNDDEKCLTCDIFTPEGNKCTYATTSFSTDLSYYALTCTGPDVSFTKIYKTDSSEEPAQWENNDQLRKTLEEYQVPRIEIFHVKVGGKFDAAVRMQLPPEIDFSNPSSVKEKYPLLIRVYGGPGSVRVSSSFGIGFQSYQVTSKKIIFAEIDGRGTGQKGLEMMFSVNNRLGTYEMEDQLSVAKYLIEKYPFIDAERTSIWGWSYGGYATAMTLAKDTNFLFKCGVSVAPVTSWVFYDTIYTERYMGNAPYARHYNDSNVSIPKNIEMIGKHDFMLVHGNADDNVHYQQSMVLARALEKADIMFEQLSYPDEAHGLSGVSPHLYHSLDRFWDKCFKLSNNV